ncbi:MAG: PAS domain S-box protein [Deltaproteobacteria bacterium]|nr:PAS domain S-box protein [Deltaproteobacteria bacterium]
MKAELRQRISELETMHQQAEEDLLLFKSIVNQANDAIFITNPETGHFLEVNDKACSNLGYSRDELLKMEVVDIEAMIPNRFSWRQHIEEVQKQGYVLMEGEHKRKDGTVFPVWVNVKYLSHGKKDYIVAIVRDMTEWKAMEIALRNEKDYLAKLFNSLGSAVFVVKMPERIIEFVNSSVEPIFGYKPEECVGRFVDFFYPDIKEFQECAGKLEEAVRQGKDVLSIEQGLRRKNGEIFPSGITTTVFKKDGIVTRVVSIVRDITEQKRTEKELREREEQQRIILQTSMDSFWLIDTTGRFLDVNEACCRLIGYTRDDLLKMSVKDIEVLETPDDIERHIYKVMETGFDRFETKHRCKDGRVIDMEVSVNYLPFGSGKFFGFMRDITERKRIAEELEKYRDNLEKTVKERTDRLSATNEQLRQEIIERRQAEKALKESEDRFRQLSDATLEGIAIHENGKILDVNRTFVEMFRYEPSEVIGMSVLELAAPESRDLVKKNYSSGYEQPYEAIGLRKDGTTLICELCGKASKYKGRTARITTIMDITERKRMEQELLKMQKLESLGVLAGGIAHNFNNVLTGILGNISLAKVRTAGFEDKTSKVLSEAEKGCYMAKELTQQLITFAKGGAPVKRTAVVGKLIMDSTAFTLSGSKVKPEFYIADNLWPVEIDEGQISQAINNLILNADQAMPEGGIIEVRCENVVLSGKDTLPLKSGKYVKIAIRDHGCGIAKEYLEKIFDPYFTTKQKGSGLGLAAAYSIIKKHNGYITVESEFGKGAVFYVYLPVSDKETT